METLRQPLLATPILISLVAGVLVAAVISWSVTVMFPRMVSSLSAELSQPPAQLTGAKPFAEATENPRFVEARRRMVKEQLCDRDITDAAVLAAVGRIPRHCFVPKDLQRLAYADMPAPIGHDQTISQPYIVALMTQAVRPKPDSRALDIGTGSGYQAAVLAEVCKEVYSIEILKPLAEGARERLAALGHKNVSIRVGDGYRGWPEKAPFDIIIVAAAPDHVPKPLVDQLAPGGRLVIPVGSSLQELLVIEKRKDGTIHRASIAPVMFVPMRGEAEKANAPNPK
jgi:protein-L-isoaspartate(D-aspartate) O-methyltransferase